MKITGKMEKCCKEEGCGCASKIYQAISKFEEKSNPLVDDLQLVDRGKHD